MNLVLPLPAMRRRKPGKLTKRTHAISTQSNTDCNSTCHEVPAGTSVIFPICLAFSGTRLDQNSRNKVHTENSSRELLPVVLDIGTRTTFSTLKYFKVLVPVPYCTVLESAIDHLHVPVAVPVPVSRHLPNEDLKVFLHVLCLHSTCKYSMKVAQVTSWVRDDRRPRRQGDATGGCQQCGCQVGGTG